MDTRRSAGCSNSQETVKRVQNRHSRPRLSSEGAPGWPDNPSTLVCRDRKEGVFVTDQNASGSAPAPNTPAPNTPAADAQGADTHASAGSVALAVAMYTVARLALVVVVAALILGIGALVGVEVPLLVAAVFGVLIALPLGLVLFKKLRLRVNSQIAAVDNARRARHDDLQSRLRGTSD